MKILVPVDGSPHSLAMLARLCDRLGWFAGTPNLTLLYVHPELPYKRAVAWAGKEAVHQYYEEESDAALAAARAALDDRGLSYAVEKRVGDAANEILHLAREGGFDLVAMGTHGHTRLASIVMGSVATKVVAGSATPVLLLK